MLVIITFIFLHIKLICNYSRYITIVSVSQIISSLLFLSASGDMKRLVNL